MEFSQIDCTYGHLEPQGDIAYVCVCDDGSTWYVIDGSENVNCTTDIIEDDCHLEDLSDVDCFTGIVINSLSQFEAVMTEHLSPDYSTKVEFTLNIETSNDSVQDGDANSEIIRILKETINKLEQGYDSQTIKDVNGNNIGDFDLSIDNEYEG